MNYEIIMKAATKIIGIKTTEIMTMNLKSATKSMTEIAIYLKKTTLVTALINTI